MLIAIDACVLTHEDYRGIAQMLWQVIRQWKNACPQHTYFLLAHRQVRLPEAMPENWHIVADETGRNSAVWRALTLPNLLRDLHPDVFWGPNYLIPRCPDTCRSVVTVHDYAWKLFPGSASFMTWATLSLAGRRSCLCADRVIAVSEATARDAERLWRILPERIRVCYNGGAEAKETASGDPYGLPDVLHEKPFLLFLSTIEPRKNPLTVLRAFERFVRETGSDMHMVFAGALGWRTSAFRRALRKSRIRDRILITGYIDEAQKRWLLQHAAALLYPSLYEGFGIPLLEAMQTGTPVITARVSSMPEVCGDAALYVEDPRDVRALTDALRKLRDMDRESLAALRERAREQSTRFSWEQCAADVMQVLEEAGGTDH